MKRICIIAVVSLICMTGYAKTVLINKTAEILLDEISDLKGVTSINLSKSLFSMMGNYNLSENLNLKPVIGKIDRFSIVTAEQKSVLPKVRNTLTSIKQMPLMDMLMSIKDGGERTEIFVYTGGDVISQFFMVVYSEDDINIIYLRGELSLDDIASLTNNTSTVASETEGSQDSINNVEKKFEREEAQIEVDAAKAEAEMEAEGKKMEAEGKKMEAVEKKYGEYK